MALSLIRKAADQRDLRGDDLADEIRWLSEAGLLSQAFQDASTGARTGLGWPPTIARLLRRIGRASLPVGRLFEGHLNAAQLIGLYASPSLLQSTQAYVQSGGLLGVWGADGEAAVRAEVGERGAILHGSKSFCSGLGLVKIALVSAAMGGCTQLFAIDSDDPGRMDQTQWRVSGMRATRSGGFCLDDMVVHDSARVGGPDDYYREPYFLGGMYRMCAVQLGGLDALLKATAASFARRGRRDAPLAQHRMGRLGSLRALAEAATERLAEHMTTATEASALAREAVFVREGLEWTIVEALQIVERALGTEVHREDSEISRVCRDLSFYIRQGAIDDRIGRAGAWLMEGCIEDQDLSGG